MIHINIEKLTNGMIFIGIGILFLLSNLGVIQWSVFSVLLQLWPLILIVLGFNILLKNRGIIVVITWLLFFIIVIIYGFMFQERYQTRITATNKTFAVVREEETTAAKMNLNVGTAKVNLDSKTDHLIYASINPQRIKSNIQYKNNKKEAIIEFNNIKFVGKNLPSTSDDYKFSLNDNVIWQLESNMGAISGDMDFSSLKIKKMDLDIGACDLKLIFGNTYHDTSDIEINGGASNIKIIIPKKAGVKLKLEGLVSKNSVESLNWQKNGDYYYSPNYQDAVSKLHFNINIGVGNLGIQIQ